jgi:hypothetical protein
VDDETFYPLLNDYGYDCSNIYCGPNAIRDCVTGESKSVPCTGDLVSTPEIESHEMIECKRRRQLITESITKGTCSECTDQDGEVSFTCDEPCYGCFPDGNCVTNPTVTHAFFGRLSLTSACQTLSATGDRECLKNLYWWPRGNN